MIIGLVNAPLSKNTRNEIHQAVIPTGNLNFTQKCLHKNAFQNIFHQQILILQRIPFIYRNNLSALYSRKKLFAEALISSIKNA